ncbi:hypothetical protein ASPCADRAFT_204501 [Aspergillus carbonarius ITEM 5010]|uniref:Uncharacterized protein n=1 Tax=Aspergillus carbonarius (strain ITEM 5010) TaxID=602072 RepID=A0A1R3RWC6_ASPC5|nr:hypothetical protein ASPCADRAFT_204501 [Aspergillus carbonarius ITEM 5010]
MIASQSHNWGSVVLLLTGSNFTNTGRLVTSYGVGYVAIRDPKLMMIYGIMFICLSR